MKPTAEEIDAMRKRLRNRQEERKADADMAEAVALGNKKNGSQQKHEPAKANEQQSEADGCEATFAATAAFFASRAIMNMTDEDWIMVLAFAIIILTVFGLRFA
jgi:hypothetical protein